MLTLLMLSSGCLGLLDEGEETVAVRAEVPLEITLDEIQPFAHDQRVMLDGQCNCEQVGGIIIASIANGAVQGAVTTDETGRFSVDFGVLPSGTYNIQLTLTSEGGITETIYASTTISPAPEDPVTVTPFPPIIYAESGESTIARVKITHTSLISCSGIWEDEMERRQAVTISGEYGSVQLDVFDYSFNGTFTITCGLYELTTATADVYVFIFSEANPDLDGDGIPDEFDRCPESSIAFNSDLSNDIDSDGCHDTSEDTDDDDDGRPDSSDRCGRGLIGWDSYNTSLDHDGDGCQDASEDLDDDDDTIPDLTDNCPLSAAGWFSTGASDYDRDGCHDLTTDPDDDNDGALMSVMIVRKA